MGTQAVCLDQNQNLISCLDSDCTYGDCGSTGSALSTGAACLDQNQNPISCSSPDCTYGDCTPSGVGSIGLASHSTENGATTLTVPASGGATSAGSTAALVSSFSNLSSSLVNAISGPPKTSLSFGASGLNVSSVGSLFSNPLMLVMLAVITVLIFGLWRKRT